MKTLSSAGVTAPGPELPAFPEYSGELPDVADTITIFRAVAGQYGNLVGQFGGSLMDRLVGYAQADMLGAMQAGEADRARAQADDYFPGATAQDVIGLRWSNAGEPVETKIQLIDIMAFAISVGHETAVDTLANQRYRSARLAFPLYWFLPVRRALELQANSGPEDDRLSAAELQGRIAPSAHVRQITSALVELATATR